MEICFKINRKIENDGFFTKLKGNIRKINKSTVPKVTL